MRLQSAAQTDIWNSARRGLERCVLVFADDWLGSRKRLESRRWLGNIPPLYQEQPTSRQQRGLCFEVGPVDFMQEWPAKFQG